MTRILHRGTQIAIDVAALSLALWLAFFLRFEGVPPQIFFARLLVTWPYVIAIQYGVLSLFGVPKYAWRYVGLREVSRIFIAMGASSLVLLGIRLAAAALEHRVHPAGSLLIPIGVILIDLFLAFLAIAGVRAGRRLLAERKSHRNRRATGAPYGGAAARLLLIGAGNAGLQVAKELSQRPDLGIKAVGFVDDDREKVGTTLHGLDVYGTTRDLADIVRRTGAKQALITIAQASGKEIRRISDLCREHGLATKIIPAISEIVDGRVSLGAIREVAVEDLLGREPVSLDIEAISGEIRGHTVMVTGAGGSIGSELCRQLSRFSPASLVLVEQAENVLFDIHRELAAAVSGTKLVPVIADVCDRTRMEAVFRTHAPEVVFHAAAHKHVPMMEWNPGEAVKNNVIGTRLLADLATAHGVDVFVTISTDKAVNPTSVMGATKRVAEIYAQALSRRSETRFVTVRFGNVLGSAGSVIPIFKEQIKRGGPVTVTHPDMRRYFMTIPEACQLVIQAGSMGIGSEIFVLDMGEPVKIVDLARDMIRLSGFEPDGDIAIEFTGLRPGEKLFEELSVGEENATKTRHPKIFIGNARSVDLDEIKVSIDQLARLVDHPDPDAIRAALKAIVPEYTPQADTAPAAAPETKSWRGKVAPRRASTADVA